MEHLNVALRDMLTCSCVNTSLGSSMPCSEQGPCSTFTVVKIFDYRILSSWPATIDTVVGRGGLQIFLLLILMIALCTERTSTLFQIGCPLHASCY